MDFTEILNSIPQELYWFFIFLSSFTENIFPPYPGDTVTVFGAYLFAIDRISLWGLGLSVYFGSLSSAILMYYSGDLILNFFSKRKKLKFLQKITSSENLKKAEVWFEKYGSLAVIFSRLSAGIRFFISIIAGITKMNIILFIVTFSFATFLWNSFLIYSGYLLKNNWEQIIEYLKIYNSLIVGIILVVLVITFYIKSKKRKQKSKLNSQ